MTFELSLKGQTTATEITFRTPLIPIERAKFRYTYRGKTARKWGMHTYEQVIITTLRSVQ